MPIDVEFCAVGLHAYGSFEESVSTVSSEGQEGLDHSISGRVWMDHQYNGRELLIETEDGRFLLVHCQGGTVAWRVGRAKPNHLELRVPPFEETVFFQAAQWRGGSLGVAQGAEWFPGQAICTGRE
ncbi:hypothetical protein [Metapseudomonas otitidis]|uniref:hypothetical protein n=1 Tax=Metapseudomonas otitidis TaxID=319939 RepID=UPI0013F65BB1|nr:hypothetical protein [Pseudomonas otitidis]